MTEDTRPDFQRYQYGALAGRLASSKENGRYAPSALEILAGAKGLGLGPDALGFIEGTKASPKGIETAIKTYAGQFEQLRGAYKPSELIGWYSPVLDGLDQEVYHKILATLQAHDETIGSIKDKYEAAQYLVEAPKSIQNRLAAFSTEAREKAKEAIKKYENVLAVMSVLDSYRFENLRNDAVNETRKADLKKLAEEL